MQIIKEKIFQLSEGVVEGFCFDFDNSSWFSFPSATADKQNRIRGCDTFNSHRIFIKVKRHGKFKFLRQSAKFRML